MRPIGEQPSIRPRHRRSVLFETKALSESDHIGGAMSLAFYCLCLGYVIRRDEEDGTLRLPAT